MRHVDNLSIPLGGGAGERLPVSIRTRPAPADPTSIATLHDEAIAQIAIALRLITLAFGPLHSVHDRAHSPSLGTVSFRGRKFADSPLEQSGFEPLVSPDMRMALRLTATDLHPITLHDNPNFRGFVDFLRTELDRVGPAHADLCRDLFFALLRSDSPFSKPPIRPELLLLRGRH